MHALPCPRELGTATAHFLRVLKEALIERWQDVRRITASTDRPGHGHRYPAQTSGCRVETDRWSAYLAQRVVVAVATSVSQACPRSIWPSSFSRTSSQPGQPRRVRGKNVVVVGGGDSAVEAALALWPGGNAVFLVYYKNKKKAGHQ